jgi:hypothetical protein
MVVPALASLSPKVSTISAEVDTKQETNQHPNNQVQDLTRYLGNIFLPSCVSMNKKTSVGKPETKLLELFCF